MTGTDAGIRLHRRQYIVGPAARPMAADWVETELDGGRWLSHCPDLRVERTTDADGRLWTLLGLATQTCPQRPDPRHEVAGLATRSVPTAYERWAGRWSLIGPGQLHLDGSGLLGCHWVVTPEGATWASSSPAALIGLDGVGPASDHHLRYEHGLSWVVPPHGRRAGVRRLLPSQILDLERGSVEPRRLVIPPAELLTHPDPAEAAMMAAEALAESMRRLPAGQPLQLGLTAGADSRLVLAAALVGGVDVELFTRRTARMSVADRVIPPRLAASVGLPHREVMNAEPDPTRWRLARRHTDDHVSAGDALPFIEATRDGFTGFEVGGQGFGAAKAKDWGLPTTVDDPARLADLVADLHREPAGSPQRRQLADWLQAAGDQRRPEGPTIDLPDRFYIEQRLAGWQASKEQLYDLNRHERFFPVNSARTLGLLLAIPEPDRRRAAHQIELIRTLDERLLAEPFNPPGRAFGPARRLSHVLVVDRRRALGRAAAMLTRRGHPR